jgi:hypothetical protein
MRDEVLSSLIDRALSDEEFRHKAQRDLEGTLREYGYELEPDELEAVREFHGEVASHSPEELEAAIVDRASSGRGYG